MKKLIALILLVIFVTDINAAKPKKVNSSAIAGLVREYNLEAGFEVISIGGLGLGLTKRLAAFAAETDEEKAALKVLDNLKRVIVVDYEDASPHKKTAFTSRVNRLLEGSEKIVEIKDEGETFNLYGSSSNGGDTIDDLVIFVPEDCALICIFGSISAERVADIIKAANE